LKIGTASGCTKMAFKISSRVIVLIVTFGFIGLIWYSLSLMLALNARNSVNVWGNMQQSFIFDSSSSGVVNCSSYDSIMRNFPIQKDQNKSIFNVSSSTGRIVIYQYGDVKAIRDHAWYLRSVQSYARKFGYGYILDVYSSENAFNWVESVRERCVEHVSPDKSKKLQGLKPFSLFRAIEALNTSQFDWVVYLDLDVAIATPSRTLESFIEEDVVIAKSQVYSIKNCFLAVQDNHNTLNTGMLIFSTKDVARLRNLADDWISKWFMLTNIWDGDQIAFQYSVFDLAQDHFNVESRKTFVESCKYGDAHGANICYDRFMRDLSLKFGRRSFGDVCIIPTKIRLNMHNHYTGGDFLFHGRDKRNFLTFNQQSAAAKKARRFGKS
jgi:hypothetical protein